MQPSRRLSTLPRRCDPPNAPEGDAPEGSEAEPAAADAAAAAGDATERSGVHGFKVGEIIDGKVRNINKGVVWVDVGIPKGAWLLGEKPVKLKLKAGEQLTGLRVDEVDILKNWISVSLPDLESLVKDRPDPPAKPPKSKTKSSPTNQAAGGGSPNTNPTANMKVGNTATTNVGLGNARTLELTIAGISITKLDVDYATGRIVVGLAGGGQAAKEEKTTAKAQATPAKATPPPKQRPPPPPPTAEELAEIEDLEVGATLKAKVVTKSRAGVFVNLGGKTKDSRVERLRNNVTEKLEWEEELDVTIVDINKSIARVLVSISEEDQAKIEAREQAPKKSIESFEVGQIVSGYVAQASRAGIFVDIGAERDALLRRSGATGSLRNGNFIKNMQVVDVDLSKGTLKVSASEGSEEDEEKEKKEEEE